MPAIRVRDTLGALFEDAQFTELFATRGRPAVSPARPALVSVLQLAEGLSDRQAADAVRACIDCKYALGLELSDTGFDASVLSAVRELNRLELVVETMRAALEALAAAAPKWLVALAPTDW